MIRVSWMACLVVAVAACPQPAPQRLPVQATCIVEHSPQSTQDKATAGDVCDRFTVDDAALPPQLASAGCTSLASYQLGLGYKPFRYAMCPAFERPCSCDDRHVCASPVAHFLACYANEDMDPLKPHLPYGWAKVLGSPCDACFGAAGPPAGKIIVAWHEGATCLDDNAKHEAAIKAAVPGATDPKTSGGGGGSGTCRPNSGCPGGCMNPGSPYAPH